ncbi:hypothetical protein [Coprobacter tertius]|uniref:Terminase n=1 Tax=Coprobacter tertius TaxID=2944915 RepID=A0ABT1MIX2_9BACT|nr:hypothetical protein [Coprobacter tertius]MCP9612558.1 hypothetical protein [Coprobacter tertius]
MIDKTEITSEENRKRKQKIEAPYYPETGEGCVGERKCIAVSDAPLPLQYVPLAMAEKVELVKLLSREGSLEAFAVNILKQNPSSEIMDEIWRRWIEVRVRYDFEFWAIMFVKIKNKLGDSDIPFRLNRPQRRLLQELEQMRLAGKPIRLILLKARQWGGSTLIQIYMAWIQLVHRRNWNSVICAHLKDSAANIKGMYSKLLESYPAWLVDGDEVPRFQPYEKMNNTSIIAGTGCRVTIGSAETPESIRGADAVMAHLSEVAFWPRTKLKSPESLIRSVCGSVALLPYSIVVLESTANGTGNYFHQECERAKRGESDKQFIFIPWFEIEMYAMPVEDEKAFIASLDEYECSLWERGATLEAIAWYRQKRKEYADHADMMAEYPSDDVEAFNHSGERVFDIRHVQRLRQGCRPADYTGEIYGASSAGKECLKNLRFTSETGGLLRVWALPENKKSVKYRYITVVDIGGRSVKADYSVIVVFDRYWMAYGGVPEVVAQWRGHIDHDLLAWKSAQIAAFYQDSLLVIESNTLETEHTDGEHTEYLLDTLSGVYTHLYARAPVGPIRVSAPLRWGFHMNRSTKTLIINHQILMLRENGYIERDTDACYEHDVFERKPNGSFGAMDGHHDDILITRCIGNYICYTEPLPQPESEGGMKYIHVPRINESSF